MFLAVLIYSIEFMQRMRFLGFHGDMFYITISTVLWCKSEHSHRGEWNLCCGAWLRHRNRDWPEWCAAWSAALWTSWGVYFVDTHRQGGDLCRTVVPPDGAQHIRAWPTGHWPCQEQGGDFDWSSRCIAQASTRANCIGWCRTCWPCQAGTCWPVGFSCLPNRVQEDHNR